MFNLLWTKVTCHMTSSLMIGSYDLASPWQQNVLSYSFLSIKSQCSYLLVPCCLTVYWSLVTLQSIILMVPFCLTVYWSVVALQTISLLVPCCLIVYWSLVALQSTSLLLPDTHLVHCSLTVYWSLVG